MLVPTVNLLALGLFLAFLADAWTRVRRDGRAAADPPVWAGLGLFALALGALSIDLPAGGTLHYSGAAFLALTLGYCRALLTMTVIVALSSPLGLLGPSLLADALVPVWLTCAIAEVCRRRLPRNPFVFLLGCGFFGVFAVCAVQVVLDTALQRLTIAGGGAALPLSEQLLWGLLLAAGEATLEGMLITILVVYAPRAVRLFDDRHYLSDGTG